jgi:coiled-coil domain-containing protein 130
MSSLAAARADNFYYPPEWTPEQGSINKFQKSHPLGKRAAKISEGILVIRFEMPYNCWCTGCSTHIGKGVRYNAEKKKVGAYFTTPIWQFTMPCYYCDTVFVIKTDPERRDYEFVSGVRRKVEEFEPEDNETYALKDDETRLRLEKEPIFKLETGEDDKRRAKTAKNAVIGT